MIYYIKKRYLVFLFALFLVLPFSKGLWADVLQTPENNSMNSQSQGPASTPSQMTLPPPSSMATTPSVTVDSEPSPSTNSGVNVTNMPPTPNTVTPNTDNRMEPNTAGTNPTGSLSNSPSTTTNNGTMAPTNPTGDIPNNVVLPSQKLDSNTDDSTANEEKISVFDSPSTIYKKVALSGATIFIQPVVDDIKGVIDSRVIYVGGTDNNPSHDSVMNNKTPGYVEAVQILYDPLAVNFIDIIDAYVKKTIQPSRTDGQFCYKGNMYAPKIYYYDSSEQTQLDNYFKKLATDYPDLTPKIAYTKIEGLKVWPAEEQYQKYYENNNVRYNYYYQSCSVDAILKQVWSGQPADNAKANNTSTNNTTSASSNKNTTSTTNSK